MIGDSQPVGMDLEQEGSLASRERLSVPGGIAALVAWIMTRAQVFIEDHAPLGYEDSSGFHFGPEAR
jgi:hypothetical protein